MVKVMNAALVDPARSSAVILSCSLLDHRQRDGQRGATQYEVDVRGPEGTNVSRQLVSVLSLGGPRTRRLWRQIEEMHLPDVEPESGLRPFAYGAELDVLFQVFPFDARLPALRQLAPAPSVDIAHALDEDNGAQQAGSDSWHGELVRYRPDMRATVRLAPVPGGRSHHTQEKQYFAKVFRDPDQAYHAYRIQDSLFQELSSAGSVLQVARPVPLAPSYNTVVTAAVAGTPLDRVLKRSNDPKLHLRATARAIAALHSLRTSAPLRSAATESAHVRQSGKTVIGAFPTLETRVRTIIDAVASGLHAAPTAFVHGDLKPEHVLASDDGRVTVIDFDLAVMADPMVDIAHFIAFLERSASRSRSGASRDADLIPVFLDEYFASAPSDSLPRLGLYHAATAVHKAAGLCRNASEDNIRQAEQILDEGLLFALGEVDASRAPSFKRRMTRTA